MRPECLLSRGRNESGLSLKSGEARPRRSSALWNLTSKSKVVRGDTTHSKLAKMVALTYIPDFDVLKDPRPDDSSLPAFMVSTERGFLPRQEPVNALPSEFDALESLLGRMPIKTVTGEPGLLASGSLGEAVDQELSDLSDAVEQYRDDLPLMTAIYRDYSFLASAYLLEPCHMRHMQGKEYGLGRQVLPARIAKPMAKVSAMSVPLSHRQGRSPTLTSTTESDSNPGWNTQAATPSITTASPPPPRASATPTSASSAPSSTA